MTGNCHVRFCSGGRGREAPPYRNLGGSLNPQTCITLTHRTYWMDTSLGDGNMQAPWSPSPSVYFLQWQPQPSKHANQLQAHINIQKCQ